mmetsp:Transcript_17384/g.26072  ORF Transcript_17384/g.26072 Transcript_17384/m.26072 type:complete len:105 (-) Transcript_17384:291-605(-)
MSSNKSRDVRHGRTAAHGLSSSSLLEEGRSDYGAVAVEKESKVFIQHKPNKFLCLKMNDIKLIRSFCCANSKPCWVLSMLLIVFVFLALAGLGYFAEVMAEETL